ncbi:MAG: hypothetical protein M1335_00815 [Chloroflexi bacterium]|nr:hypothetical protein [Chloroflexota bacterium]
MLPKETILGAWQKYSGTILSQSERLTFYESCKPLQRFDEQTLRTALNFCKKESDFSVKRVAQLATAVRRGTVSRVLRRTDKDTLIEKILYERGHLVPVARLDKRFKEAAAGSSIDLTYTEVERAWRIAALTLADRDERWREIAKPPEPRKTTKVVPMLSLFDGEFKL